MVEDGYGTVHLDRTHAGQTDYANEMLYWHCGTSRYYAGQVGRTARYPVRARGTVYCRLGYWAT